ncbi:MAG: glycine cleavage system protein GcvH [Pseudomonadota bacterium]|nr:glycine cleavage system protein GcvH [Pseudomonadota bacterium]
MSTIPDDLKYTRDHEWVRAAADGTLTVGITDFAQKELGELVFVELPQVGQQLASGDACATVESVKAVSEVFAPADGKVVETNASLADSPELINDDPYGEGWLFRLKAGGSPPELLDAAAYRKLLEEE